MTSKWRNVALQMMTGLVAAALPLEAASAQNYPPQSGSGYRPPQSNGYRSQPPASDDQSPEQYDRDQGYGQDGPDGYADAPPPPPPPPDYDGTRPPPPPPGYQPDPAYGANPDQDQHYEAYAEDWAQRNCVKSRSNAGTGAVIGGLLGALVGSGAAGWRDRGTGALVGGIAGAAGGAAIGSASEGQTSPGCPPGFVVRSGAPAFYYEGYGNPYYYAAPDWYRPWVFVGDRWTFRPYPYHAWYYHRYFYGRPGWGRGYHGYHGYRGYHGHWGGYRR